MAIIVKIDGIDGAGKSTLVEALSISLASDHLAVLVTREFGRQPTPSTASGPVDIDTVARAALSLPDVDEVERQALFMAVSRYQNRVVLPSLASNCDIVLSDRSSLTNYAYSHNIRELWHPVLDTVLLPVVRQDMVIYLQVDPEIAFARRRTTQMSTGSTQGDMVEVRGLEFQRGVEKEFERLAAELPYVRRINAVNSFEVVLAEAVRLVKDALQ